jgi:hypothetical protein
MGLCSAVFCFVLFGLVRVFVCLFVSSEVAGSCVFSSFIIVVVIVVPHSVDSLDRTLKELQAEKAKLMESHAALSALAIEKATLAKHVDALKEQSRKDQEVCIATWREFY